MLKIKFIYRSLSAFTLTFLFFVQFSYAQIETSLVPLTEENIELVEGLLKIEVREVTADEAAFNELYIKGVEQTKSSGMGDPDFINGLIAYLLNNKPNVLQSFDIWMNKLSPEDNADEIIARAFIDNNIVYGVPIAHVMKSFTPAFIPTTSTKVEFRGKEYDLYLVKLRKGLSFGQSSLAQGFLFVYLNPWWISDEYDNLIVKSCTREALIYCIFVQEFAERELIEQFGESADVQANNVVGDAWSYAYAGVSYFEMKEWNHMVSFYLSGVSDEGNQYAETTKQLSQAMKDVGVWKNFSKVVDKNVKKRHYNKRNSSSDDWDKYESQVEAAKVVFLSDTDNVAKMSKAIQLFVKQNLGENPDTQP